MNIEDEFEISEGVVLRGINAESIARNAWSRPRKKQEQPQEESSVLWCRPREHDFVYRGGRMVNGKWCVRYECCRCSYKVTI